MSIIEITNFSQNYGDKKLFENSNFILNKGEKLGIIGVNGAGKSTLLKIIAGKVLIDKGNFYINPRFKIEFLNQNAEITELVTIKEFLQLAYKNLYEIENELNNINHLIAIETNDNKLEKLLNKSGELFEALQINDFYSIDSNINKIASGLGILDFGLDTLVKKLSGGQRAKVILAKLLLESPDVMILDEPTNFLDVAHIDWLTKFIKASDKAFVIVSHDYKFLNNITTHICDVDNFSVTRYTGNVDQALRVKNERNILLEKSYESQQKEIKKLKDYIARNSARASTAGMAQSRAKTLNKIQVIEPPSEKIKPTFSFSEKSFGGNLMLKIENLIVGYNKPILSPISLEVNYMDKVAIVGFNGIGKSTLLKTIIGAIPKISGNIEIARTVEIGYYEQENDFHNFNDTPLDYVQLFYPKLTDTQLRAALYKCGLNKIHLKKQISQLSGGEQSKIKICVITLKQCNLLILDEPTNHLDVLAIERLKEVINNFNGAVIFVSHDKHFVSEVATKTYNLENIKN